MHTSESKLKAPKLSVTLDCPATLRPGVPYTVSVRVAYEADNAATRPITFHTYRFTASSQYAIYRHRDGEWKVWNNEARLCLGFLLITDEEYFVNVSQDENFASLGPGESWVTTQQLRGEKWTYLPEDMEPGETLRYAFHGTDVSWWDWGSKTEHEGTILKMVDGLVDPVIDPKEKVARPKLVIPASKAVEFSFAA
jgi:hypothetical protein